MYRKSIILYKRRIIFQYKNNPCLLSLLGSINGAYIGAGTALNAGIGIDNIFVLALGDRGHRALALAGTAFDAFVINFICHGISLLF